MGRCMNILAVGLIASKVQKHPDDVLAAADRLGIPPRMRINNVPHFDEYSAELIGRELYRSAPQGSQGGP